MKIHSDLSHFSAAAAHRDYYYYYYACLIALFFGKKINVAVTL